METMLTTVHPSSQLCFPSNIILNPSIASSILLEYVHFTICDGTKLKMYKFATSHLGPEIFLPEFCPWVLLWSTLATWEHKESRIQILLHIDTLYNHPLCKKNIYVKPSQATIFKGWILNFLTYFSIRTLLIPRKNCKWNFLLAHIVSMYHLCNYNK